MDKKEYFEYFIPYFEKQLGWGKIETWTHKSYIRLSTEIFDATGVNISYNTLKRIFGKISSEKPYQPHATTEDALAQFIGFKDWMDFVHQFNQGKLNDDKGNKSLITKKALSWKKNKTSLFLVIGVCLIIALSFYLFITNSNSSREYNIDFECLTPTFFAPGTTTFKYHLGDIKDSVFISQGKKLAKIYLSPQDSIVRCYYSKSGYYNVRLLSKDRIFDSTKILAQTQDYEMGYSGKEYQKVPLSSQKGKSFFSMNHNEAQKYIDAKKYWLEYKVFDRFNAAGDHFSLQTKVKSMKTFECEHILIEIICEHDLHRIYFNSKKCCKFLYLKIGEYQISGENNILDDLCKDFSTFKNIDIYNNNQTITVYLEGKQAFKKSYAREMGQIVGLKFGFEGNGAIKHILLRNQDKDTAYLQDFKQSIQE